MYNISYPDVVCLFQALHKADVLDKEYQKIKSAIDEAKTDKKFSPKQITRQIVQLTEVRHFPCIIAVLPCFRF